VNRGERLQERCTGIFLFHRAVPFDTAAILLEGADKSISVSIIYPKSPYHLEQSERQPFLEKCLQAIPFDAQSDGAAPTVLGEVLASNSLRRTVRWSADSVIERILAA
jgi:hypothetical protein